MPKSYWNGPAAFLAFGICLIAISAWISWHVSAGLTEESIRAEKTAEYHDNYAEDAIDEKCLSLEPIPMRDCIHQEIEAARNHERSEQDLDAQQAMARFTKVMGWTAVAGLVLAGASVTLIFLTLSETQRMAGDTRKIGLRQVAQSRKANQTAREIGIMQTRAYLTVESATIHVSELICTSHISVKNVGQSPTRGVRCNSSVYVNGSPDGGFGTYNTTVSKSEAMDVTQGAYGRLLCVWFVRDNESFWKRASDSLGKINLECTLTWVDVFGSEQTAFFQLVHDEDLGIEATEGGYTAHAKLSAWKNVSKN